MTKNEYGVWEITVPPKNGECAIPHDSKIKVCSYVNDGMPDSMTILLGLHDTY